MNSNIGKVVAVNISMLHELGNTDKMLRTAATTVLGLMKVRIHKNGLDANDQKIGTYSAGYMVLRTGTFKQHGVFTGTHVSVFTSGGQKDIEVKSKSQLKSGVFSKGKHKGEARPRYNRTSDTTIVLSLTRHMENDMKVIAIAKGYGIGYSNVDNYKKSQWVEATYKKPRQIFALTTGEIEAVNVIAQKFINDAIPG